MKTTVNNIASENVTSFVINEDICITMNETSNWTIKIAVVDLQTSCGA